MNKFEHKLKLDIAKYCDNFIEIKEDEIKRLIEIMKTNNEELKSKYDTLILSYNNNEELLNNNVDKAADIEGEFKTTGVMERDFEKEFYDLIEQIHINMEAFEIKDELKLDLIDYISKLIEEEELFENKLHKLNIYSDNILKAE